MISSQSLRLKDEDSLLNSILDLYSEDQKYSILFEYVIFTNVKKVTLRRFFETFESSDVNHQLWESVISIFLHEGEEIKIDKKRYVIQKVDEGEEIKRDNVNKKKVVFIGEASCGKTRIIYRELNAPCENILPTLAVDAITIKVDDNELKVFDTSGQMKYRSLSQNCIRNSDVIVVVYDACNSYFMEDLDEWIDIIHSECDDAEIFIVCNKIDAVNDRETIENGRKFANENNYHFIETSAKDGTNIQQLFTEIAKNK